MCLFIFFFKIFDYYIYFIYYFLEMDGIRMCFVFLIFFLMMIFVFIINLISFYENINRKSSLKEMFVKRYMRENEKFLKK